MEPAHTQSVPETRSEAKPGLLARLLPGRRRTFLVDPGYQLRASLMITGLVLGLLVLLNLSVYLSGRLSAEEFAAAAPELGQLFHAQARGQMLLVLLGSAVLLTGVFLISILETHKTAGAAYKIRQALSRLEKGEHPGPITLREGDNLTEIAEAFNRAVSSLARRQAEQAGRLEQLALSVRRSGGHDAARIADELERMARTENSAGPS